MSHQRPMYIMIYLHHLTNYILLLLCYLANKQVQNIYVPKHSFYSFYEHLHSLIIYFYLRTNFELHLLLNLLLLNLMLPNQYQNLHFHNNLVDVQLFQQDHISSLCLFLKKYHLRFVHYQHMILLMCQTINHFYNMF